MGMCGIKRCFVKGWDSNKLRVKRKRYRIEERGIGCSDLAGSLSRRKGWARAEARDTPSFLMGCNGCGCQWVHWSGGLIDSRHLCSCVQKVPVDRTNIFLLFLSSGRKGGRQGEGRRKREKKTCFLPLFLSTGQGNSVLVLGTPPTPKTHTLVCVC